MTVNYLESIGKLDTEEQIRAALTQWCEEQQYMIYWGESAGPHTQPTFSLNSKGLTSYGETYRPDMLIVGVHEVIVVEIKMGDRYGNIADGVYETFEYWSRHHRDQIEYQTSDGNYYTPTSFALATRHSIHGHIYPREHEFYYSNGEIAVTNERIPQYECNMTGVTIRSLWRFAQGEDFEVDAGIGFLLADILEEIPYFDRMKDQHEMVRASKINDAGQPSLLHWNGDDQDWIQSL